MDSNQFASNQRIGGPYIKGQKAYSCGHYYPDCYRASSHYVDGKHYYLMSCLFCGEHLEQLDEEKYGPPSQINGSVAEWQEGERTRLRQMVIVEQELLSTPGQLPDPNELSPR